MKPQVRVQNSVLDAGGVKPVSLLTERKNFACEAFSIVPGKESGEILAETQYRIIDRIIEGKYIHPVYQPVVSLADGKIFGYEALSRISSKELEMNIEQMFRVADRMGKLWELETLCRAKAMENFAHKDGERKLFLNVNPNIIYDKKFTQGFTKSCLEEFDMNSNAIIFEITERASVIDNNAFLGAINHYKKQNYGIAIDDVGAGYSGLNLIVDVKPGFMKLDMNLVRNIDRDKTKFLLCKAMVDFCKGSDIKLVAEGIESEEELKTLIKLRVDYGQGYFLGIPRELFDGIAPEKTEMIKKYHSKRYSENVKSSIYPIIGYLSQPGYTFSSDERVEKIYDVLRNNPAITEFSVVEEDRAIGFVTRTYLNEMFGGRFGYSLNSKRNIQDLMMSNFLRVNYYMPIDLVSQLAMQRPYDQLYNPIVVEKEGEYVGMVTIKELLDACTKIEIDVAVHLNPLTRLPGNLLIEQEILHRIFDNKPYCITYYDIDNFKAYNDAYGFENGDLMLSLVADTLKECAVKNEFIGHIGGDDFIVIGDYHEGENYCASVIDRFSSRVTSLYRDEDLKNGCIISKNRHGMTESFPIASLSIAGISNKKYVYQNIDEFSQDISHLKKKCKRKVGNYFEIL
ncbi:EAL domain-containing protein [Oxalobacter vibrioformis]|uniref:EAL domain-containing protein n=1 Tax=Oxalobacter vibrioformis TaxID=933080 RepID=A0A9E9P3Z5_9BURK|nr:EAL domain-containing protein [Oxalobacter vibrioformis]WAW10573.1 EAL domain-containing protein [Oxalobacter vibrioformis]